MVLIACIMPTTATTAEFELLAVSETKAIVYVEGKRRVLTVGETSPEGVMLVDVIDSAQVVIENKGHRDTLSLNAAAIFPGTPVTATTEGEGTAKLWAGPNGFFYANGAINGYPVRFLVDTGATIIAIDHKLARRIGLDYSDATPGLAHTAGGSAPMVATKLNEVSVGDITLQDVEAGIMVASDLDMPLLGMSFLGQLDMVRIDNQMELKQRQLQ